MDNLKVVSSVISMHKGVQTVKIIEKSTVSKIELKDGSTFFLHYNTFCSQPVFAISDKKGGLITGQIDGAQAVGFFVHSLQVSQLA